MNRSYVKLYSSLIPDVYVKQPEVVKQPEEVSQGLEIVPDAVQITLAEYDVKSKNAITAHHLKDYRRRKFNLILLPKIEVLFDKVLEGSEYWGGLLHNEGIDI